MCELQTVACNPVTRTTGGTFSFGVASQHPKKTCTKRKKRTKRRKRTKRNTHKNNH
ncbi:hypothetical protein J7J26_03960 [Candidatus Micrarchaeota archaeon]|nr:hypothetical protein [Candidatus Micrarchaeota archaeon]